jgi:hypothetical protein
MASRDKGHGPWVIVYTPEVNRWLRRLTEKDRLRIETAIKQLRLEGPTLGPARSKLIKTSRHHNMKELLSVGGHLRVLYAFDPHQRAVLFVGGDKAGDWDGWYLRNVKVADAACDKHLRSLGKEGAWKTTTRTSHGRANAAGR